MAGRPGWMLEPEIELLIEESLVRRLEDGRLQPLVIPEVLQTWPEEHRRSAHRALGDALPLGAPQRLRHIAVSGDRTIGDDGRCHEAVGNTVDIEAANWTNTIGASELATIWTDPDFDPQERAFYYVRVLEIPKPTWQAHDAKYFAIEMDDEVPMVLQDRAYTSPIWYTPGS